MESLPLPLALEDFLPVILSGLGMFFLARLIVRLDRNCGHLASLGFLLITLGGFFKALWKLILAATDLHIAVLNNSLFIFMAPGFVLMAWAIWKTFNSGPGGTPVWVVPVIIIVVGGGAAAISALSKGGRRWFFILLGVTTVASVTAGLLLAWQAWRRGLQLVALLFAFNLVTILFQASLVRLPHQTVALLWIEQINNTISWAAFAYAAWDLERFLSQKH
jgi:hypothetical protein